MTARRTEPTGGTLLTGRPYRNAASTDIRETFRLAREGQLGQPEFAQIVDQYSAHHPTDYARRIAFGCTFNNFPF